jgi:hypothetical protein
MNENLDFWYETKPSGNLLHLICLFRHVYRMLLAEKENPPKVINKSLGTSHFYLVLAQILAI